MYHEYFNLNVLIISKIECFSMFTGILCLMWGGEPVSMGKSVGTVLVFCSFSVDVFSIFLIYESPLLWLYIHQRILNNPRKASGLNYKSLFLLYGPADLRQKLCFSLTRYWSSPQLPFWDQRCFGACSRLREMTASQGAKPNNANILKPLCFFFISAFYWPKQVRWQSLEWGCLLQRFYLYFYWGWH